VCRSQSRRRGFALKGKKMIELINAKPGDALEFTQDFSGIHPVKKGDKLTYLGNSTARIITGQSKDLLVLVTLLAPIKMA